MEYWELIENPKDKTYQQLIEILCTYSDKFYFVTEKELQYNQNIIKQFEPFLIEKYKKRMGKHINKRSGCNCFCHGSKQAYMQALQQSANALYDWVSPKLPEDLTFIKNNFTWFTCTTHEAFGGFSIRSDYYKKLITQIDELKIELVE